MQFSSYAQFPNPSKEIMINHQRTAIPTRKGENTDPVDSGALRTIGLVEILWTEI